MTVNGFERAVRGDVQARTWTPSRGPAPSIVDEMRMEIELDARARNWPSN